MCICILNNMRIICLYLFQWFTYSLKQLRYFGIIEYIKKKYYRSSCSRDLGVSAGSGAEKMDLQLQQSSFYLLIMGFILGFIAFVGELIYHKVSERKICCF